VALSARCPRSWGPPLSSMRRSRNDCQARGGAFVAPERAHRPERRSPSVHLRSRWNEIRRR
jgi:hypothetical protein